MKRETLESKTTEELKEMAAKKNIEGRSQMNKSELIDSLSSDEIRTTPGKTTATDMELEGHIPTRKKTIGPETVEGHITIKGLESGDRRLFQTNPNTKEWLTQGEAEDQGFYWKEDEDAKKTKKL
jgi:Rho termination factor-like protein